MEGEETVPVLTRESQTAVPVQEQDSAGISPTFGLLCEKGQPWE